MDVNQTSTIAPTQPDGRQHGQSRDRGYDSSKQNKKKDAESGSWREREAVDFNHRLVDALTPEVQVIIDSLNQEIEPLRQQLERARSQLEEQRRNASQHTFLNVPNRQEIFRELSHVLQHHDELTTPPTLALLHVENADWVRVSYGRSKLDHFLSVISQRLTDEIRGTDSLGNIGGNDFALIILGIAPEFARDDVLELVAKITHDPIALGADNVKAKIHVGIASLNNVSSVDMAVKKTDENLMRELSSDQAIISGNSSFSK